MLKKLHIEQFVIIDTLDLDFQSGLTILTGETGAGKSILLDAMGLILGDPSAPEAIRQGASQSVIEATFAPPASNPVWMFLAEHKLVAPPSQEFVIHRTVKPPPPKTPEEEEAEKAERAERGEEKEPEPQEYDDIRVNGNPIPRDLLKKLGAFLVEIHGQFANQSLMDPANQLHLLDLSGAFPPEVFKNVAGALRDVHRLTRELEEEKNFLVMHKKELPKIEELVTKLEKIGMKDGFVEQVQNDYTRMLIARESSETFQAVLAQLIAANGVVMGLSSANQILKRQQNLEEEKVEKLARHLAVALENARAAVNEMRMLAPEYEIDTSPLQRLEDTLNTLERISRECKVAFEDLTDHYVKQAAKLKRLKNGRETVAALEDSLIRSKKAYLHHAHILTEKRIAAGRQLSDSITAEFPPLKLMKAEFNVLVEEKPTNPWTELGLNDVTFTARMNPGMPFSPVSETASGGELARLILALKVVLQRVQTIPTLIFDEVDTGIGGAAAAAVGERIALLSDNTQVLVITHSPQVASRGHQHLHVSKKTDGVTTTSVVNTLSMDERIDEISRMLSGDTLTAESHAAARKLIDEARQAAIMRQQKAAAPPVAAPASPPAAPAAAGPASAEGG